MTSIMDDIHYLSLSRAADKLNISEKKIITLASSGQVTLSTLIPDGYTPWLMTVRNNILSMRYLEDYFFEKMHLFPRKIKGAVLLNLTKEDCSRFEYSNLVQGTFKSVYINDHLANIFDSNFNYLELLSTDEDMICSTQANEDISDNEIYFSAERAGIKILNNPNHEYCRRFVLFKDTYAMPKMGTSLAAVKALDINESNLLINSNDYKKLLNESKNIIVPSDIEVETLTVCKTFDITKIIEDNKDRFQIDFVDWCGNSFHYLINFSSKVPIIGLNKNSYKREYSTSMAHEVTKSLESLGPKDSPIGVHLVQYFLILAAPDDMYFDQKALDNIKMKLSNEEIEQHSNLPIQLLAMIIVAKELGLNQDDKIEKKIATVERFKKLGFSQNISEHASTIIRR